MATITLPVRVKPGSSRDRVLGAFGGPCDDPPARIVAVTAPPVDGRANEAVVGALADALGLRRRQLEVISGHTARTKVVRIDVDDEDVELVQARVSELLNS